MTFKEKRCILCRGSGSLNIGSNMQLSKKEKQIQCPICLGKGWLKVWIDNWKDPWNKLFNRDKK